MCYVLMNQIEINNNSSDIKRLNCYLSVSYVSYGNIIQFSFSNQNQWMLTKK